MADDPNESALLPVAVQRRLSIVVPAYNEEAGIAATLAGLRRALPVAEVIAVDDGSRDDTADAAAGVDGVVLLRQPFNRGYGASLKTGMLQSGRELVAWFDADNEHRVEDLAAMVRRLEDQRLAAVIGMRRQAGRTLLRSLGKWLIRTMVRSFGLAAGADLNCGLRVFRRAAILPYLSVISNRFSASMTSTLVMIERGYPIAFHPVDVNPRVGASKVALRDGFDTILLAFRLVMLFAPLRVFVPSGLALLAAGGAYGGAIALYAGRGLPIASLFLMSTGVLLVMMGLIADQISQFRLGQFEAPAPARGDSPTADDGGGGG